MTESREAFEAYFAESRRSRGAGKRPTFEQFEDGTYKDDHTQRHWWTWQQAQAAKALVCAHGIHKLNACGACTPPRGSSCP